MSRIRLRRIVAQRNLALASATGGAPKSVVISFSSPIRATGTRDFVCHYRIDGLSCRGTRMAMGIDSLQALFLAMTNAASILYTCEEFKAGRLTFLEDKNLGLPAFSNMFSDSIPGAKDLFIA